MPKIPKFASEQEESEFWDTHDLTDYWDETAPVDVEFHIAARSTDEIEYPESDGAVSESNKHALQRVATLLTLHSLHADRPDVFVGGNSFVYYQEGDPTRCFSPDTFVALGVRERPVEERGSYKIWEEGVPPALIIELASKATRKADQTTKLQLYARLGVREYFLFDPLGTLLRPRLQGYRLQPDGQYIRLAGEELESEVLGLRLVTREGWLRFFDPRTGTLVPNQAEDHAAYQQEHAARLAAEQELARLRAELARLRGPAE